MVGRAASLSPCPDLPHQAAPGRIRRWQTAESIRTSPRSSGSSRSVRSTAASSCGRRPSSACPRGRPTRSRARSQASGSCRPPRPRRCRRAGPSGSACGARTSRAPHTYSWIESANAARQVCDYLAVTGVDNVTRPGLVEKWEASPGPQDLDAPPPAKRQVAQRPGVHGRRRRLEPQARPRCQDGLVHGRPHEGVHPRGVRDRREGRQGQREEVHPPLGRQRHPEGRRLHRAPERPDPAARDSRAPLPLPAAHAGSGRERRVQGRLQRHRRLHDGRERGRAQAGLQGEARLLGRRTYLDTLEFIDLGDDPAAQVSALAGKQVDGLYLAEIVQLEALQKLPPPPALPGHTAYTATARMQPVKPFDDKRVRQAMRYAIDADRDPAGLPSRPRPAWRAPSREPGSPRVREAPGVHAGRREGEEAARRRRPPERDRRRARVPSRARLGARRRRRRWSSSGRKPASGSRSTSCHRPSTGRCGRRCRSASRPGPTGPSGS